MFMLKILLKLVRLRSRGEDHDFRDLVGLEDQLFSYIQGILLQTKDLVGLMGSDEDPFCVV
jgi:hypothetical protein